MSPRRCTVLAAVALACLACSDDGSSSGDAETGDTAPVPGPSADGWESAYTESGVRFDCSASADELDAAGVPALRFADTAIYVGFRQVGQNQDPLFARYDGGSQTYCQIHETEPPDGRALGLTWDGGDWAYVVYSIVGGGSSLENRGGWLPAYAPGAISGGGPKVSVLGRVAASSGALDSATFVIAVKSDNKVNSHGTRGAPTVLANGDIEFLGASAHKAIDADGSSAMDCTDYPFDSRYVFSPDLSQLVCAECSNCVSQRPCE